MEGVMFFDTREEEEEVEEGEWRQVEWYMNHGVMVTFQDGILYFVTDKDRFLYIESDKREYRSQLVMARHMKRYTNRHSFNNIKHKQITKVHSRRTRY